MSFAAAEAGAASAAIAAAGETVTYRRGAQSVVLTAATTRAEWLTEEGEPAQVDRQETDFCLLAAGLVLGGSPTLPAVGDQLERTIGSATYAYEVRHPAGGQPWRWLDRGQTALRIHTKYLGAA